MLKEKIAQYDKYVDLIRWIDTCVKRLQQENKTSLLCNVPLEDVFTDDELRAILLPALQMKKMELEHKQEAL